jgi:hypothetical protein
MSAKIALIIEDFQLDDFRLAISDGEHQIF